jgi:hypothetical protein
LCAGATIEDAVQNGYSIEDISDEDLAKYAG